MRARKAIFFAAVAVLVLTCLPFGCSDSSKASKPTAPRVIMTSDTILSGMVASLLPPHRYSVRAILPPGQCPGHYDVKLSDIEKVKGANLIVSFKDMPYMVKAGSGRGAQLLVDPRDRNWMAPDSYLYGLGFLADRLSEFYPEDREKIERRRKEVIEQVRSETNVLKKRIRGAGIVGRPVIASSMQRETLQWMGFHVVAEYGRPETVSAREVVRISRTGRDRHAILVVDNLQSGPDVGKGIAEAVGVPHVVLTNFPSEKGYLATLEENIDAVLEALKHQ